jgi:anionic cell wall polymer biosynthesis LytR-Cps2A-Psr (LCP) family protein
MEDGSGLVRIVFKPGCQLLDGHDALAYARTRHQDSDYGRMKRQQRVLVALARQVDPLALLPAIPELLDIAGDHLWTTIDPDDIAGLAGLGARMDTRHIARTTFVPPSYPSHLSTSEIRRIRAVVRSVFDEATPDPEASEPPIDTCR